MASSTPAATVGAGAREAETSVEGATHARVKNEPAPEHRSRMEQAQAGLDLLSHAVTTAGRVLGKAHPSTRHFENSLMRAKAKVAAPTPCSKGCW